MKSRRKKLFALAVAISLLIAIIFLVVVYLGYFRQSSTKSPVINSDLAKNENVVLAKDVKYELQTVATGLDVPWSIVFTSDTRILVSERKGAIRIIENGNLKEEPLAVFSEVVAGSEEGFMGLALHPDYQQNKYIYASLVYAQSNVLRLKIIRFKDELTKIGEIETIIDEIPAAAVHAGCRIRFGPDGKLYITTGDAAARESAQDLTFLGGKILRINDDGTIPADNPFKDSPVYSYGHRNPQGIDWHPTSGILVETEHGPSGFDGPGGGDEVNIINSGRNYGWPLVSHEKNQPGLEAPVLVFTPAEAPASGSFYTGSLIPEFKNNYFFGALKGAGIIRVVFSATYPDRVIAYEKIPGIELGRIRDIVTGPDGALYFSTSNRDGRGNPASEDDKIIKIIPVK